MMHAMDANWISITDAAARLNSAGDPVDRTTLSRYLKQHAEALPTRREGRSNLVEFGALAAHRAENIRIRGAAAAPVVTAATVMPGQGTRFKGSQSEGAARKAQADAELREMDLAERRGELTAVDEVDKAGRAAIAMMQSAFERAIDSDAARASVKYSWDERLVRLVLKGFVRNGIDEFHREVLKYLDGFSRAKMAAEQGDDMPAEASQLLQ